MSDVLSKWNSQIWFCVVCFVGKGLGSFLVYLGGF